MNKWSPVPGGSHVNELFTNTDFFYETFHHIEGTSGPAIPVGGGKYVYLASARTPINDGHSHMFVFASLIEDSST